MRSALDVLFRNFPCMLVCVQILCLLFSQRFLIILSAIFLIAPTPILFLSKSYFFLMKLHVLKYVAVYREQVVQYDNTRCLVSMMVLDLHHMWGPSCTQIFNMLSPKGRAISVRATLLTVATALQVCSEGRGTSFQHG